MVHVVADSAEQAVEDLTRDWAAHRRPTWAIDTGTPSAEFATAESDREPPAPLRAALRRARLEAQRTAVLAVVPPDPRPALRRVEVRLDDLRRTRAELAQGRGPYAETPVGEAARALIHAEAQRAQAERFAAKPNVRWRMRRSWAATARRWAEQEAEARTAWERLAAPDSDRLVWERDRLDGQLHDLETKQTKRQAWLEAHPEAARRLARLDQDLRAVEAGERVRQALDRLQIRDGLPLSSPEQTLRRS